MFTKKITFLFSVSQRLQFVTIQYIDRLTESQIAKGVSRAQEAYSKRLLTVCTMDLDRDFKLLRNYLTHVNLNTMTAIEHVP